MCITQDIIAEQLDHLENQLNILKNRKYYRNDEESFRVLKKHLMQLEALIQPHLKVRWTHSDCDTAVRLYLNVCNWSKAIATDLAALDPDKTGHRQQGSSSYSDCSDQSLSFAE